MRLNGSKSQNAPVFLVLEARTANERLASPQGIDAGDGASVVLVLVPYPPKSVHLCCEW